MSLMFIGKMQKQLLQREKTIMQSHFEYLQSNLKAYFKFLEETPVLKEHKTVARSPA